MKNKHIPFICLVANLFITSLFAQNIGINTLNPQAALDINGDVVFRTSELEITDSLTTALDVNTEKFSSYRITEADSSFFVSGLTAAMDGRVVTLINLTGYPMTFNHDDSMALEANRIVTGNHEPFTIEDMGSVMMQYDTALLKWIISSSSQVPAGSTVWDTTEAGIYFEEFVGIGTDSPSAPLTILTEIDEPGFTHTAGEDSITVASSVSELAGSVGTITDHVFSLKAGGEGKMHIWPDGNVVIGEDSVVQNLMGLTQTRMNPFDAKVTVVTPPNYPAFSYITTDQVIVKEGVSGLIQERFGYSGTFSYHPFRLACNSQYVINMTPDGKVGIGTDDPLEKLAVYTPGGGYGISQRADDGSFLTTHIAGGNASIGTWSNTGFRLLCNSQNVINMTPDGRVGIGTLTPFQKLDVNGTIRSKELIVELINWPDYVFDESYKLTSLNDLEKFIDENNHLPNIPSAKEVETNGQHVGALQQKMMEKIEELTLYIIELNERIEFLENKK